MTREFRRLCRRDLRLALLHLEAVLHPAGRDFCALAAWEGRDGLKARLGRLVGFGREGPRDPDLEASWAYDLAYRTILDALPACRGECRCGEAAATAGSAVATGRAD